MQTLKKRTRIYFLLFSLFFIAILIAFLLICRTFISSNKSDLTSLLPNDIELVIDINTKQFIKNLLFQSKFGKDLPDFSLFKIQEIIKEKQGDFIGFDNTSQIVFFQSQKEDVKAYGFLFHIQRLRQFNQHTEKNKNTIRKGNKNYGIIIYLEDNSTENQRSYYEKFAEKTINNPVNNTYQPEAVATVKINQKNEETLVLSFQIEQNKLNISGTSTLLFGKKTTTDSIYQFTAKEKPFLGIQLSQTPNTLNQMIKNFLSTFNFSPPPINSQQLNIYSTKIEAINKRLVVLPEMDWILRFEENLDLKKELNALTFPPYLIYDSLSTAITIKNNTYYLRQLSNNEIYIGNSKSPELVNEKANLQSWIKGHPEVLFSLIGESFIGNIIRASKPVTTAKHFLKELNKFEINFTERDEKTSTIEGEISLNKDEAMSVALLKLFL